MATTTNPTYAAALAYVERGFRVIPIHSAHNGICSCKDGNGCPDKMTGKHPVRERWQTANQAGDPAMRDWWNNDKPKNVGIATGRDSGGLLVVDVDGEAGIASMKELTAEHGREWLGTYRVKTGGGGWHFFFHMDPAENIGNSAGTKLGKGIDTRGNGGYVIAPPSVSKKGPYTVVADVPILPAPEWLLDLLRPKERKTDTNVTVTNVSLPDTDEQRRLDGYTKAAVEHEVGRLRALHPEVWDGNPWDNTTFEVACNLIQLANAPWNNLSVGVAYEQFWSYAPRDPGFDDERVAAKWDSALKKIGDSFTPVPAKPLDILEFFAGSDLNAAPVELPQGLSNDNGSGNTDDEFVTNVGEPDPTPEISAPTVAGIPVVDWCLDPAYVDKALAEQLGNKYRAGAAATVELEEIEANLANLIDAPTSLEGVDSAEFAEWLERNLQSSDVKTFWAAMASIKAGVATDGPTIVFKGGGAILASLAALLRPAVGEDEEMLLFGPRVSTREVDGPQIIFAFGDEPMPPFDPLALVPDPTVRLEAPDESEEIAVRLPDYRALQLERARLGLAPRRREAVMSDATEDAS